MQLQDFVSVSPKERLNIYRNFDKIVEAYFENSTEKTKILAEWLVLKRTVNTLTNIFATKNEELPVLFAATTEIIWNYLSGECSEAELAEFSKAFTSYYDYLNDYFDQGVLKQYPAFIARYDGEEAYRFITAHDLIAVAEAIDDVCGEIAAHELSLRGIGNDYLLYELAKMAAFAEKIDLGHPEYYQYREYEARDEAICQTDTFANVMRCIDGDMRAALDTDENNGDELLALREQYQSACFFEENQFAQLYRYFLY